MTQEKGIPYRRHKPSAALREFLDPLDPGSYFDCGQARLHGLDDALLREAESRGRQVGDDTFQLVATDMGLIFCRPSISFAIAARWDEVMLIRPHGDDPVVLPVTWPTHGELKFTLSRRLAANTFRRWLQLRMQTERNERREKAERFTTVELESPTRTGDWEVVSKVEPPDGEDPSGPTGPEIERRDADRKTKRVVRDRAAMAKRGLERDGHTVSMPPGVLAATKRQPVPDELPSMIMRSGSPPPSTGGPTEAMVTATEPDSEINAEPGPGTDCDVEIVVEADVAEVEVEPGDDVVPGVEVGPGDDVVPGAEVGPGVDDLVDGDPVDAALDSTTAAVEAPPEPAPPVAPTRVAEPRSQGSTASSPDPAEPIPVPHPPPVPADVGGAVTPESANPARAGLEDAAASDQTTAGDDRPGLAPGSGSGPQGASSSIRTIERPQPTPPSWIGSPMSLAGAVAVISTLVLVAAVAVSAYRRTTVAEIDPAGPTSADAAISAAGPRTTVDHRRFTPLGGSLTTTVVETATTVRSESGVVQTVRPPAGPRLCNSNYSGCVPDVSDVDCPNDGDGPLYSTEPAVVMGDDVYELDTDGDGDTCEPDQPRLTELDLDPASDADGTDPNGDG